MASPETEQSIGHAESGMASVQNLKLLENIEVKLTVEVGGTKLAIRDLLKLNEGSIVELERLAGEHLDILVNGTLLAKGEIVLVSLSSGQVVGRVSGVSTSDDYGGITNECCAKVTRIGQFCF